MVRRCFLDDCPMRYPLTWKKLSQGEKMPSLFKVPNEFVLKAWEKVLPKSGQSLTTGDSLCSLHFDKEDIITHYETTIDDGTVWRQERGTPRLKCGAMPKYFDGSVSLSNYSTLVLEVTSNREKRIAPTMESTEGATFALIEGEHVETVSDSDPPCEPVFTFDILKNEASSYIQSPAWTSTISENFVSFLMWDVDHMLEKWILITKGLQPKVYVKGIETTLGKEWNINSPEIVIKLVEVVQRAVICQGAHNKCCLGYLQGNYHSRKSGFCQNCYSQQRMENRLQKRRRRDLDCEKEDNFRLKDRPALKEAKDDLRLQCYPDYAATTTIQNGSSTDFSIAGSVLSLDDDQKPGPFSQMEFDSRTRDVHMSMTCDVYPAESDSAVQIKQEPPEKLSKPDIRERESEHHCQLSGDEGSNLLQPPVLIKDEIVSSEDEL